MNRILLVIDSLTSGGAQRQLVGLAALLKQNGYDVKLIYYIDCQFYKPLLDDAGVESVFLGKESNKFSLYVNSFKKIKRYINSFQPDVVISFLRIPSILISFIHCGNKSFKHIASERNLTQNLDFLERLKFRTYRHVDKIVPNSQIQRQYIESHFPEYMNKTVVITNFVDTDYFHPATEKSGNAIPRIVCVGRITRQKNILTFLDAVRRMKDDGVQFSVAWYGGVDEKLYWDKCRETLEPYGLSDVFEFKGVSSAIREEYWKSDIFCLPSLFEGFPNVLCEAMSCGLPVACGNVCDNPDIVDSSCGVLFNPEDAADIAGKLTYLLSISSEMRDSMGAAGRKRAVDLFSPDVFVRKYESLFADSQNDFRNGEN